MKSGFGKVGIEEQNKEKTAFSIENGSYQFDVILCRVSNALNATFERLMEIVLCGLNWKTCLVYLDDIMMMERNFDMDKFKILIMSFECPEI